MSIPFRDVERETMEQTKRFRHDIFRSIMTNSVNALKNLREFEANLNFTHYFDEKVETAAQGLFDTSMLMAQELNLLTNNQYKALYDVLLGIKAETRRFFEHLNRAPQGPLVLSLDNDQALNAWLVGEKAARLAFLRKDFPDAIPWGVVISSSGYELLLESNHLQERIGLLLNDPGLFSKPDLLRKHAKTIRGWLREATVPEAITEALQREIGAISEEHQGLWVVRSSMVNEETSFSLSGLSDYKLGVSDAELSKAYLEVITSHFSERALKVRMNLGMREIKTPMSVLVMAKIDPIYKGVLSTKDFDQPQKDSFALTVYGTAQQKTKTVHLSKQGRPLSETDGLNHPHPALPESLQSLIPELCQIAEFAIGKTGSDLVLEWAHSGQGRLQILQGRSLQSEPQEPQTGKRPKQDLFLATRGLTVCPGRAEGGVVYLTPHTRVEEIQRGAIVVADKAGLNLTSVIPQLAALLLMAGDPSDPAAILALESSVPCICQMGPILKRLQDVSYISVDATRKQVIAGSCWSGTKERTLARIADIQRPKIPEPIFETFLASNLSQTEASAFKTKSCNSILDIIHFISEIAVRALFKFGDSQKKGIYNLKTKLPLKLELVDMNGSIPKTEKGVLAEEIKHSAFSALWQGLADERLHWPNRWEQEMRGIPGDLQKAVLGEAKEPRKSKAPNYAILSKTHMNLNARISYHYVMVDTIIGPGTDNNHIFFRFRGSGGSDIGVIKCAEFIETILKKLGFGINRMNETVTAWLMYSSSKDSLIALEQLGRLIVCARELDAVLKSEADTTFYGNAFLQEQFSRFS